MKISQPAVTIKNVGATIAGQAWERKSGWMRAGTVPGMPAVADREGL